MALYSRNGRDLTKRFPSIADAIRTLSAQSAILDGDLVASTDGSIDFYAVASGARRHAAAGLSFWAFDLLERDGKDLRDLPLQEGLAQLEMLRTSATWPASPKCRPSTMARL